MAALVHAAVPEEACIVCADEMRCGLLGTVRQVWAPRGMAVRQPVQQVRAYQYLHLAVATQTGQLWWRWEPRMHGAAVLAAVQQWQAAGVGAVIWDHAGSHQDFLVQASGLAFIGLPAYAPGTQSRRAALSGTAAGLRRSPVCDSGGENCGRRAGTPRLGGRPRTGQGFMSLGVD